MGVRQYAHRRERRAVFLLIAVLLFYTGTVIKGLLPPVERTDREHDLGFQRSETAKQVPNNDEEPQDPNIPAPKDDITTNFKWTEAQWHDGVLPPLPDETRIPLNFTGSTAPDHLAEYYKRPLPIVPGSYTILPFGYFSDGCFWIANGERWPSDYIPFRREGPTNSEMLYMANATRVDCTIAIPALPIQREPRWIALYLPLIMMIPEEERAKRKVLIPGYYSNAVSWLLEIGFTKDRIVVFSGAVKGADMLIIKPPEEDHVCTSCIRKVREALTPPQPKGDGIRIGVLNSVEHLGTVWGDIMHKHFKKADARIDIIPDSQGNSPLQIRNMQLYDCIIGLETGTEYYLPYMKPGSLAIVVHGYAIFPNAIKTAAEMGVRTLVMWEGDLMGRRGEITTKLHEYFPL